MSTPNNVASGIGVGSGAPTDVLGVSLFLARLLPALDGWIATAANAVNWLLSNVATLLTNVASINATLAARGSYVSSGNVSATPGSATPYNHATITLTPGDWDINGAISYFSAGNNSTQAYAALSTVSLDTSQSNMETTAWQNITTPATSAISATPPVLRLFVPSGTTTVYLVGYYVGTITVAYGRISARRAT